MDAEAMGVSSRRRSSMRCKATVRCGRSRWSCRYGAAVLQSTHCPVRTMDYSLADSCQQSPKRPLPLRGARWAASQAGPPPETHRQTWASSSHSGVNRRKSDLHEVRPVAQCIARHHCCIVAAQLTPVCWPHSLLVPRGRMGARDLPPPAGASDTRSRSTLMLAGTARTRASRHQEQNLGCCWEVSMGSRKLA